MKQSILLVLFLLSGFLLDGLWTWYSYHFEAGCADTGNSVPATWFLFTGLMLIPAAASLIFRSQCGYFVACLAVWLIYAAFQLVLIGDDASFERIAGINCYRDVGAAAAVSAAFSVVFAVVIVAITLAFGMAYLVRMLRERGFAENQ